MMRAGISHSFALIETIKDGIIRKSKYRKRGLDQQFQGGEIRKRRSLVFFNELDEQDEQLRLGIHDDSRLLLVYDENMEVSSVNIYKLPAFLK